MKSFLSGPMVMLLFLSPLISSCTTSTQFLLPSLDGSGYVSNAASYSTNSYDVDEHFTYLSLEFLFRSPGDR